MNYFRRFFSRFRAPEDKVTGAVGFNEPAFAANSMTVDKLHGILRSAEQGDVERLFALYRDIIAGHSHLQSELNTRKLAVLGDSIAFVPRDKARPEDVLAAKACERLKECPTWTLGRNHLLNGALYPLALVEKIFAPAAANELGIRFDLVELAVVPFHALDYTDKGHLKLWEFDEGTGIKTGRRLAPRAEDYIVHRGHLLTMMPDYWGGPLRAALFWWLFSVMDRDWWIRFLSRFGAPFMVAKYNPVNKKDKATLTSAFAAASQLLGLVISKDTEVEVKDVATNSHGDAFEKMHAVANRELSKLILGQTMTSEAQAQGLGGAQAAVHNMVRGDIKQWDARSLADTLESQLCQPYLRINGLTGSVKMVCGAAGPEEIKAAGETIKTAHDAGLELTDEGIEQFSELSGMPFRRAPAAPALPAGVPQPGRVPLAAPPLPLSWWGFQPPVYPLSRLPWPAHLPTDAQLDRVAETAAEGLGAAFHGIYAPVRRLILESTSPADLEARLTAFYADHNPEAAADLIAEALTAYAANGAVATRR